MKTKKIFKVGIFCLGLIITLFVLQSAGAQNLLSDPSFEAGSPNPSWFESSTNAGTPLCTVGTCGTGSGTAGPHSGNWWAWFGGVSPYEEGIVSQSVVIPAGSATLSFWLWIGHRSGNGIDYLSALMDGNPVFTVYEYTVGYDSYTQVTLDVSSYADGAPHTLEFLSEIFGPVISNISVDDVELVSNVGIINEVPIGTWSIFIALGLIIIFTFFRLRNSYSA